MDERPKLEFARVWNGALWLARGNWGLIIASTLIFAAAGAAFIVLVDWAFFRPGDLVAIQVVSVLAAVLSSYVVTVLAIRVSLRERGKRHTITATLAALLPRTFDAGIVYLTLYAVLVAPSLVLVGLMSAPLWVGIGVLLVWMAAVYAWFATAPAVVAEPGRNILATLSRSFRLGEHNRWRLIAVGTAAFLLIMVIDAALSVSTAFISAGPVAYSIIWYAADVMSGVAFAFICAPLTVALYLELRHINGEQTESVAATFD